MPKLAPNPTTGAPTEYCYRCAVWHYTDAKCNPKVVAWHRGISVVEAEQRLTEFDRVKAAMHGTPQQPQ